EDLVQSWSAQGDGSRSGARLAQMLRRIPGPEWGRVRNVRELGRALGHLERRDGVGSQRQMRAMLLEAADRHQDDVRVGKEPLQIRGCEVEQVVRTSPRRLRVRHERAPL